MTFHRAILRHLALAIILAGASGPSAHAQTAGNISIEKPWSRATPASAPVAGGYMTISNTGEADRLLGGTADIAAKVEVHEMSIDNGIMKMREVSSGLPVPASGSVELKPGGYHIMFTGLKHGLKEGDHFKATFRFEKAGPVTVDFTVGSIAGMKAPEPAMQMQHQH